MKTGKLVVIGLWVASLIVALYFMLHTAAVAPTLAQSNVIQPPPTVPGVPLLQRGAPLPGAGLYASEQAPGRVAAPPSGVDLDVTYISRDPMYRAYCVHYEEGVPSLCAGTENEQRWPAPGEAVTFTAHVKNKGTVASPAFSYVWAIDGTETLSGTLGALAPGAEVTTTYTWTWTHMLDGERVVDDHTVRFAVDPGGAVTETYESNNVLEDRTNALGFIIGITPEMVAAYDVPWNSTFSYSAEDWLQRQIAAMNQILAQSVYTTTPQGAMERVRINQIVISSSPPVHDGAHDGGWFVDADYRIVSGGYDAAADVDWNLVHELSHQIGVIDLYNLDIAATNVEVTDRAGQPVNFGFRWPRPGLMGGGDIAPHANPRLYSAHTAAGIMANKGYRRGYYGEYQYDMPQDVYLRILDQQGGPAGDVAVTLYQRQGPWDWAGGLAIDATPEITGVTGADGRVLLSHRPTVSTTTRTGHTLRDNPFGVVDVVGKQNRFLVRLNKGDHEAFIWLDITPFNLAYWQGDTISHTFTISGHVPVDGAPFHPAISAVQVEGSRATLCWPPGDPDIVGYRVYRAAPLTYDYAFAGSVSAGATACFSETYDTTRIYAVTSVLSNGLESAFSAFAWAPKLLHPYAVGHYADGTRVVLDPQNGYALLRQGADGAYLENFGSPHYHLEYAHFFAIDGEDRLIFSHPADYYSARHSVRIADRDANPVLEFGERGSGPGQFETPTGVAVWGTSCGYTGPYTPDGHTLLLLHLDGSYEGAQGEPGIAAGTVFTTGQYGQAAAFDDVDTLVYTTTGNLNREQGAVEFWLRPDWDGDDKQSYTFFEVGDTWFNRMRIMKDGADNLRFMLWDDAVERGIATHVAHWTAGEWHHVAVTWEGSEIALHVDGQRMAYRDDSVLPVALDDVIHVGSSGWVDQQAHAAIDELRISDIPRVGNSDTCSYRLLVADSGNHRLQVFDGTGGFVSAYGSEGSGPGQFRTPMGLAVTGAGQVVVADRDNHRLQLLDFDGTTLSYTRALTANFSGPQGVAALDTQVIVADTGNSRIKVLDTAGTLIDTYAAPNDGHTGTFLNPRGVAVARNGSIVVADTGNRRVVAVRGALFRHRTYLPLVMR